MDPASERFAVWRRDMDDHEREAFDAYIRSLPEGTEVIEWPNSLGDAFPPFGEYFIQ